MRARNAISGIIAVSLAAVFGAIIADSRIKRDASRLPRSDHPALAEVFRSQEGGDQLVMVIIGSSRVGVERGSPVVRALKAAQDSLRRIANRRSMPFVAIGIALDYTPVEGLDWLDKLGIAFDEVSAGQSWLGMGAIEYLWRDSSIPPGTPQVLAFVRRVRIGKTRLDVSNRINVLRMSGAREIESLVGLGAVDSLLVRRRADVSRHRIENGQPA